MVGPSTAGALQASLQPWNAATTQASTAGIPAEPTAPSPTLASTVSVADSLCLADIDHGPSHVRVQANFGGSKEEGTGKAAAPAWRRNTAGSGDEAGAGQQARCRAICFCWLLSRKLLAQRICMQTRWPRCDPTARQRQGACVPCASRWGHPKTAAWLQSGASRLLYKTHIAGLTRMGEWDLSGGHAASAAAAKCNVPPR